MTLVEFMCSDLYVRYLDELDKHLPEKIDRDSKVHDVLINLQSKWLEYAAMTTVDLEWSIVNYKDKSISYIINKKLTYTEQNGGKDNIVNEVPKINFPIGHLIEFYLLTKNPDGLPGYVKVIRIPNAKKYIKEITDMYCYGKNK